MESLAPQPAVAATTMATAIGARNMRVTLAPAYRREHGATKRHPRPPTMPTRVSSKGADRARRNSQSLRGIAAPLAPPKEQRPKRRPWPSRREAEPPGPRARSNEQRDKPRGAQIRASPARQPNGALSLE